MTAFGGARAGSWAVGGTFVLTGLWLIDQLVCSRARNLTWAATPVNGWIALWLALALVALVPLPAAWVAVLSPQVYQDRLLLADIARLSGHGDSLGAVGMNLIYNVSAGVDAAVRLGAGLAVFFLVLHTARSAARIQALALILALLGLIRLSAAAVQRLGAHAATGLPPDNDLAGFVIATLPFAFGLVVATRIKAWAAGPATKTAFRLDRPWDLGIHGLAVLSIVALILTANRAAIHNGALVATVMAVLLSWRSSLRRFALLPAVAAIVLVVAATVPMTTGAWAGPQVKAAGPGAAGRPWGPWTLAMVRDYPVLGTGLGSLPEALPRYTGDAVEPGGWTKALLGGGVGFALAALAVCVIGLKTLAVLWRKRRDPDALGIGTAAIGAWIAAVLANGWASHLAAPDTIMALAAGAALGLIGLQRHGTGLRERVAVPLCQKAFTSRLPAGIVASGIAGILLTLGAWVAVAGPLRAPAAGVPDLIRALDRNPAHSRHWLALADAFKRQEQNPYDWFNRRLPLSDRCIDACLRWAPFDADLLFQAARHWLWRSALAGTTSDTPERRQAIDRFQDLFRRCLAIDPGLWQKAADLVWAQYPSDAAVLAIVPPGDAALKTRVLQHLVAK